MSNIGRNDPCPCGSGKKYKNCCLNRRLLSVKDRIEASVKSHGFHDDISRVFCNMYDYMEKKKWMGACHAVSSVLYVALSEIGYNPTLCIGEVSGNNLYFDHSWIMLNQMIVDFAINKTLLNGAPASGIIIFDQDIDTGLSSSLSYGVPGRGIEDDAKTVSTMPFTVFMNSYPDEEKGLWSIVEKILETTVDVSKMEQKYRDVQRTLIR